MALVLSDTPAAKVWCARPESAALPPHAGRYLLAGAALVGGAIALGFAALGAWMVLPFTGLELVALWWALRHVARSARDFEEIRLEADRLQITTCIGGELQHCEFHAYWAQVHLLAAAAGTRLIIRSHGREAEVGRVLGDAQKSNLAQQLKARLAAFRALPVVSASPTPLADARNKEDS